MAVVIGIPRETFPGERRVGITPRQCEALRKSQIECIVEHSAGVEAGFPDSLYEARGARMATRAEVFASAEVIVQVRTLGANPEAGRSDLPQIRPGQIVIGMSEPLTALREDTDIALAGASLFALELIPRITRAQSMDVLSSMATIAGYRAVLIAAETLPKMFPMLMTAAGTITPAKVFVLGVGVAGLQAIATAKRLGAVVSAYDVRAAVKEQVESVGAKFVVLDLDAKGAEGSGGYAKTMGEDFYRRQRELLTDVLREQDVVITTAAVPGKKAPVLVTKEMVSAMPTGSVLVDIAAERGGNCEVTRPGESFAHGGVTVLGPMNLASTVPFHGSQMYASNVCAFLKLLVKDGSVQMNLEDEILRETLVAHGNQVVHPKVREAMGVAEGNIRAVNV